MLKVAYLSIKLYNGRNKINRNIYVNQPQRDTEELRPTERRQ